MENWREQLQFDPIPPLLASENRAVGYFVRRDLLGEEVGPLSYVWDLPEVQRILSKQRADGSWRYPGRKVDQYPGHYRLLETWKQFRFLVDTYEFTRDHPGARRAAELLFSFQTGDGDIRGMIGNQYATYYTGAIMALLIRAGHEDDPRISRGFEWLLAMRQDDMGWTIPILTVKLDRATMHRVTSQCSAKPIEPDRTRPFSHNWTGMVLRAFAAHPTYRESNEARIGGTLLKSRFFQKDVYTSHQAASYWVRFQHPFWWNNLLAALDSLSQLGFNRHDPDIKKGLDWFLEHQEPSGLWKITYVPGKRITDNPKNRETQLWVSLAVCRMLKRFDGAPHDPPEADTSERRRPDAGTHQIQ